MRTRSAPAFDASVTTPEASIPDAGAMDARVSLDAMAARDAMMPSANDAATDDAGVDAAPRDPGTLQGSGALGYYYAAREADYTGTSTTVVSTGCANLASVSSGFVDAVCVEGVGKLDDGRVLQFADLCACGYTCPNAAVACFALVDESVAPWGRGASGRSLEPLRSIAVNGTGPLANQAVYLPALDGVIVAATPGIAGFVHDGCVRADDAGSFDGALDFRLFTGDIDQYTTLEAQLPYNTTLEVYVGAPHCQGWAP